MQTNREITGEVLIEISDISIPGLRLFTTARRNWVVILWRIITVVFSCIVTQEELVQAPVEPSDTTESIQRGVMTQKPV